MVYRTGMLLRFVCGSNLPPVARSAGLSSRCLLLGLGFLVSLALFAASAVAQTSAHGAVRQPSRKALFREDTREGKRREKAKKKQAIKADRGSAGEVEFSAGTVEYLQDRGEVQGRGGVLISGAGVQAQADSGTMNSATGNASLAGGVLFSGSGAEIRATKAKLNVEQETGGFENADLAIYESSFYISSDHVQKVGDDQYSLQGSSFTTCGCSSEEAPWKIECASAEVTEEGYAHAKGASLRIGGVPVLYSPYLVFPVKRERATGLLVPSLGYSNNDGFLFKQPFFWTLGDSADLTITPFIETQTRRGLSLDYRRELSLRHGLEGRFTFSDESPRNGSLRGAQIEPGQLANDNLIDESRLGAFYRHQWRTASSSEMPASFNVDVHYVSDDLYLREMDDALMGDPQSRYTVSSAVLSVIPHDYLSGELSGVYSQALDDTDDDTVLQRIPELNLRASRNFRPFGYNPYGVKLKTTGGLSVVDFMRNEGTEGVRFNVNPGVTIPFHYGSVFNSALSFGLHHTMYRLRENLVTGDLADPADDVELPSSSDRSLFTANYAIATALERVYPVSEGGTLQTLTGLGFDNQATRLVRIKHSIEPEIRYSFVPDVDQDDLPIFDPFDRVRERSLITFGVRNRIYGRFLPRGEVDDAIPELTPRVEDLPVVDLDRALGDMRSFIGARAGRISSRRGEVRELLSWGVRESYDQKLEQDGAQSDATDGDTSGADGDSSETSDSTPERRAWSDINTDLTLYPSDSFALRFDADYAAEESHFSSLGVSSHFFDDRGDALRARYSYVDDQNTNGTGLSQLEANIEIALIDRLKLGYYGRYDEQEREFLETRLALRLLSACDCWKFDVGISDRVNPDRQAVMFNFTLGGLGDLGQNVSLQ